jgi:hypothetical protein
MLSGREGLAPHGKELLLALRKRTEIAYISWSPPVVNEYIADYVLRRESPNSRVLAA